MENQDVIQALTAEFAERVTPVEDPYGDAVIRIDRKDLVPVAEFLRKEPYAFIMLLDLTCVDFPDAKPRFEMVYHLFSLSTNLRVRIKAGVPADEPTIASLTGIWRNANWLEREIYDMFGVRFSGHPDLRRLFMYDGFEGHPLRKDYPLRRSQPLIPLRGDDAD